MIGFNIVKIVKIVDLCIASHCTRGNSTVERSSDSAIIVFIYRDSVYVTGYEWLRGIVTVCEEGTIGSELLSAALQGKAQRWADTCIDSSTASFNSSLT